MAQPVAEVAAAVLAASTSHGQLLLAEGADLETARAAYRRLALQLHPDKNPGFAAAAEAFKVISSAFAALQALPERRRSDAAQPAGAPAAEAHSRWEAFTGRASWGPAAQPSQGPPAPPAPASTWAGAPAAGAAPPAAEPAAAKASGRWGTKPVQGQLFRPNPLAQPAKGLAAQQEQPAATGQENDIPAAASPASDPQVSGGARARQQVGASGVAPSAFYARGSGSGRARAEHHQSACSRSLYTLFGGKAGRSSGEGTCGTAATAGGGGPQASPPPQPQGAAAGGAASGAAQPGGSRWGSKPALAGLLRHPVVQPQLGAAAIGKGPTAAGGAWPAGQATASKGGSKQAKQQRVLESSSSGSDWSESDAEARSASAHSGDSDSGEPACRRWVLAPTTVCHAHSQGTAGRAASSTASGSWPPFCWLTRVSRFPTPATAESGTDDDNASSPSSMHEPAEDAQDEQRGAGDAVQESQPQPQPSGQLAAAADPARGLEAAVAQRAAAAAKGLAAAQGAAKQAGRKHALQRHYARRGKGRQKGAGGSGMQAKLQLVAVGSKRVRK